MLSEMRWKNGDLLYYCKNELSVKVKWRMLKLKKLRQFIEMVMDERTL